jgi:hypothetical protein
MMAGFTSIPNMGYCRGGAGTDEFDRNAGGLRPEVPSASPSGFSARPLQSAKALGIANSNDLNVRAV